MRLGSVSLVSSCAQSTNGDMVLWQRVSSKQDEAQVSKVSGSWDFGLGDRVYLFGVPFYDVVL